MQVMAAVAAGPRGGQTTPRCLYKEKAGVKVLSERQKTKSVPSSHTCVHPLHQPRLLPAGSLLMREPHFGQVVGFSHPWSSREQWESAAGSVRRGAQPELVGTVMLEML